MSTLGAALIEESKRRLIGESLPRIQKCIALLSEDEIWIRPNEETVSVGNLVLHLSGNVRQWICSGLGGRPDLRERAKEFSTQGPMPTSELLEKLESTLREASQVLDTLDPDSLLEERPVQAYRETGVSILVHVVEHFSYHTGQITYYTKSRKAVDTGYYAGHDLSRRSHDC
ncbi:MAG TPA: DinB family protein [Candidatus Hydrogenedentes bacterium]|nr:DinB family protein [Candidatus Hydrogenedentota bacterium]HRK34369.1 DinB family protein [Candidatus Hydrogenedentota bacterium]